MNKKNTLRIMDKSMPLVSIIIPVYNVEKYLKECLLSIQRQTYPNLEIILINDGSTDSSLSIAEEFANLDERIIIYSKENGGLSSARNKGIELATGKYIWFIDSDDLIQKNAVKVFVDILEKTGSDFAVGSYCRFNSFGYMQAAHWIRQAHHAKQEKLKLQDYTDILVNAIACSKMIKREFILKNNLYFPIGVLYEDQLWSAKLYSSAKAFDILPDIIYDWRVRDDMSSISQQSKNVDNLKAILTAVLTSLEEFDRQGLSDVARDRVVQFMSNNMREYLSCIDYAGIEYMEELSEKLTTMTQRLSLSDWKDIPAHLAALQWLLIQKDFDKVRESLDLGIRNTNTMSAIAQDQSIVLKVPFWNDPEVSYPQEVLSLKENQYVPNIELRKSYWIDRNQLFLEGWSYVPLLDPNDENLEVQVFLVSEQDQASQIELDVNWFCHSQLDRISNHQINDYRRWGFRLFLDIDQLNLQHKYNYRLNFVFNINNTQRVESLKKIATWGAAGKIQPSNTDLGVGVRFTSSKKDNAFLLSIEKKEIFAEAIYQDNKSVVLNIRSSSELAAVKIIEINKKGLESNSVLFNISGIGDKKYICRIDGNMTKSADFDHWLIRAVDKYGVLKIIAWPQYIDYPIELRGNNFKSVVYQTAYGNVGLRELVETYYFKEMTEKSNSLLLEGKLYGVDAINKISVILSSDKTQIECEVKCINHEKTIIEIPYTKDFYGQKTFLSPGHYKLIVNVNNKEVRYLYSASIAQLLPNWLNAQSPIVGRIESHPTQNNLNLIVQPSIPLKEQGARKIHEYVLGHQNSENIIDEKIVFFRTYYGESTTCNAVGIHKELYNRNEGYKLYWSVRDSSVKVPEGGIPIVEKSKEWFELYSKAKYIIDNTHQPEFYSKKKGQIVIATFHGYPFKLTGIPYWEANDYPQNRIDSFLRRHDQWDYLLSPAPYATPILKNVFPSKNAKILEIGYPRNDVFFAEERDNIRRDVRKRLGIKEHQIAILYAPTYRDNYSLDEFRAKMIDYLDLEFLTSSLNDNYVFLLRGHMMNTRMGSSIDLNNKIIDVSDYPEISDLCLASDTAILDYSSLRFDYALTGKPMIFFVPDLEDYLGEIRGSLVPYEDTAAGPLVKTSKKVLYWISNLNKWDKFYQDKRKEFINTYMPLEDGKASQRFVDEVFK
ncbi:bifunctional glycosyltransferase/CDP-glycerol:glycerophosphate glycerophosphotransferase [Ignatzschineria cameli]|uniref:Glycosyltransferase 2-like domain-containing protein n=1 Tax=Ignatzschineria cameli TaxID=2182793 RepID=A0A2U2ASP0_9GAMM|nr:CDP-glycerol glycerophosphotransferase family protein [Ignatzschineria cameli]PWD87741.1 hypothetical protein DC077_00180 [Ignatzschineria cameli]